MTPGPIPTPPTPDLGGRHLRAIVGLSLMLFGALIGVVWVYASVKQLAQGHPLDTSFKAILSTYGFPVLLFAAGYLLFSPEAFGELVSAVKGFFPGRG